MSFGVRRCYWHSIDSIDSNFYGVYLNNAPTDAPMKWLYGQVIDMLHIDLWSGAMPSWVPIWGNYYAYCLPVFNIADVTVSAGLIVILSLLHPTRHINY